MTYEQAHAEVTRLEPQRTAACVFHARVLLFQMTSHGLQASRIEKSAEDGISVFVGKPSEGKYALVECFDDATIAAGVSDGCGNIDNWDVELRKGWARELCGELRRRLEPHTP